MGEGGQSQSRRKYGVMEISEFILLSIVLAKNDKGVVLFPRAKIRVLEHFKGAPDRSKFQLEGRGRPARRA